MQDMVMCVGTEDVFFDSMDQFSAENNDSYIDGVLGYECWMNEPRSIKERRETFLYEMGFIEPSSSFESCEENNGRDDDEDGMMLERMVVRSGDVSSSCSSSYSSDSDSAEENAVFCARECSECCNVDVNEHQIRQNITNFGEDHEPFTSNNGYKSIQKKIRKWWKEMMKKQKGSIGGCKCKVNEKSQKFEINRRKVYVNKKKFKELSALFETQEIQAHKGIIWTMKFSPDGQYLGTGGEDGVVRVWRVKSVDSSLESFSDELHREEKVKISVVPDKLFRIEEVPVHEFHGHDADVLDLAWSNSNLLLSSSMDKTVRLWKLGSNSYFNTFHHTDYVTCVQFNPIDNGYFISGSIDGKVRIWGVSNQRVLDWADIRDAVTAVCYQPDGKAFVVGSLSGSCQFYETKAGDLFELGAHILLRSSRRLSSNRITGIQFSPENFQQVMVISEDSKLRILDTMEVVSKFRGLPKSGSQMSASFLPNGAHMISIGQDSRVYLWNHEKPVELSSKNTKSNHSCEYFHSEGVSVALPWCGTENSTRVSDCSANTKHQVAYIAQDPPKFYLGSLFSSKNSATWPEEMLPVLAQPKEQSLEHSNISHSSTWGLVIVTANCDGFIKTFQNYGLPSRV